MSTSKISFSKVLPVLLAYIVMGFVDIVGVATGFVKQDFALADKQAQLLPSMIFVWFFILSVPTGILMGRFGKKTMLLTGIGIGALGMLLPFTAYSFPVMLASFIFLGIGNTIVQVAANPLLHDVVPGSKYSSYLSSSQFIKAICSLLGPIITAFMAVKFGNWKLVFLVYAVTSFLSMIWLYLTRIEEQAVEGAPSSFKSCFSLLKNKYVLFMVLGIFLYVGAEVAINTNIVSLLQSRFDISLESASLGISIFFTALMVGRFSGAILLQWVAPGKFFFFTAILSLLGALGLLFSPSLFLSKVVIFVVGLGFANLFPLIFSLTVAKLPERVNEISGLMVMAIAGGAVIPPFMGYLSTNIGIGASFLVVVAVVVYVLVLSIIANRGTSSNSSSSSISGTKTA